MLNRPGQFSRAVLRLIYYTFSPLSTIKELTFNEDRGTKNPGDIVAAVEALFLIALATWLLWKWTVVSFERSTDGRPQRKGPFLSDHQP